MKSKINYLIVILCICTGCTSRFSKVGDVLLYKREEIIKNSLNQIKIDLPTVPIEKLKLMNISFNENLPGTNEFQKRIDLLFHVIGPPIEVIEEATVEIDSDGTILETMGGTDMLRETVHVVFMESEGEWRYRAVKIRVLLDVKEHWDIKTDK